jgi:hypothetical protein
VKYDLKVAVATVDNAPIITMTIRSSMRVNPNDFCRIQIKEEYLGDIVGGFGGKGKGGIMNNEELRMNNFRFAIPVFTRTCFQFSNKNKAPHSRGYGNLVNKIFLIFDGRSNAVYVFVGAGVSMRPPAP